MQDSESPCPRPVRFATSASLYLTRGVLRYSTAAFVVMNVVMGVIGMDRATRDYSVDILFLVPILLRAVGQSTLHTVPISLLLGASLLMGRLRADRELTAMSVAGLSPVQLLVPMLVLGTVVGGTNYMANQYLVPEWRFMNRNIAGFVLKHLHYFGEGRDLEIDVGDCSLWVERYSGGELEGVFLAVRGQGGAGPMSAEVMEDVHTPTYPFYLVAESARLRAINGDDDRCSIEMEGVSVFMDNDFFAGPGKKSDFVQRGYLASWNWTLGINEKSRSVKDLPAPRLRRYRREQWELWHQLEKDSSVRAACHARRMYYLSLREEYRRLAGAVSCLTFPLAAFAIGLLTTSTNRLLPFFVAGVLVPSVFFSGEMAGGRLAEAGNLPGLSMQLGNLMLTALVVAVVWRSARGPRAPFRSGTRRTVTSSTKPRRGYGRNKDENNV